MSLTGSDSATLTEVALVESSGSEEIKGVVEAQGSGNFLVKVNRIPSVAFVVRVKGQGDITRASTVFQRQTPTNFRASNLTITVSIHPRPSPCHMRRDATIKNVNVHLNHHHTRWLLSDFSCI